MFLMPLTISRVVEALEPSATLAMAAKAKELARSGKTVYDFSVGEPDFTTPAAHLRRGRGAMRAGHTHYTAASGILELKQAVAKSYAAGMGWNMRPQQVVISNGAKHSLHNVFTALCNPGDEVIIPAPYWVSYAELVQADRGEAGDRRNAGSRAISSSRRPNSRADHPAHDDSAALLAVESDRQPVFARRTGRAGRHRAGEESVGRVATRFTNG